MKKYTQLLDKYKLDKQKLLDNYKNNNPNPNPNSNTDPPQSKPESPFKLRDILGSYMDFSKYPAGEYSYPGPDVTFTSPPSNSMVVCLGCLAERGGGGNVDLQWPKTQIPANFATGSSEVNATVYTDELSYAPINWLGLYLPELAATQYRDFTFPNLTYASTTNQDTPGQPNTSPILDPDQSGDPIVTNQLTTGHQTPFTHSIALNINAPTMTVSAVASNYAAVNLSQEGVLWTLWPLAKPKQDRKSRSKINSTYFNDFQFGTATSSNYRMGQFGYFYNNENQGCIPMGAELAGFSSDTGLLNTNLLGQVGTINNRQINGRYHQHQINPGLQGFYRTLLISTQQLVAILVVKVSEEIARVPNPASGEMGQDRFIYVGYDAWAVVRTSANPVGPMIGQTHISPQTVTGNITKENYQVIFPPNFYNQVFYKNGERSVPNDTRAGLSNPHIFPTSTTRDIVRENNVSEFLSGIRDIPGNDITINNTDVTNILRSQTDLIDIFTDQAIIRDVNTSLGGRPIPFSLLPLTSNNTLREQLERVRNNEITPFINFDTTPPRENIIDGQLQLYPRFASTIRPYVQALSESPPGVFPTPS